MQVSWKFPLSLSSIFLELNLLVHVEEKNWKKFLTYAKRILKSCACSLFLSVKKNYRHCKFHQKISYTLIILCCDIVIGSSQVRSTTIQILWRGCEIFNHSLKLTPCLRKGKTIKGIDLGKKKNEKRKKERTEKTIYIFFWIGTEKTIYICVWK